MARRLCFFGLLFLSAYGTVSGDNAIVSSGRIADAAREFTHARDQRLFRERLVVGGVAGVVIGSFALMMRQAVVPSQSVVVPGVIPPPSLEPIPCDIRVHDIRVHIAEQSGLIATTSPGVPAFVRSVLVKAWNSIKRLGIWVGRDIVVTSVISGFVHKILSPFSMRLVGGTCAVSSSISWFIAEQHGVRPQQYVVVSSDLYMFLGELIAWDNELLALQCSMRTPQDLQVVQKRFERIVRRAERLCGHIVSCKEITTGYEHDLLADYYADIERTINNVLLRWSEALANAPAPDQVQAYASYHDYWYAESSQSIRKVLMLLYVFPAYRIESYPLQKALYEVLQGFVLTTASKNAVVAD